MRSLSKWRPSLASNLLGRAADDSIQKRPSRSRTDQLLLESESVDPCCFDAPGAPSEAAKLLGHPTSTVSVLKQPRSLQVLMSPLKVPVWAVLGWVTGEHARGGQ